MRYQNPQLLYFLFAIAIPILIHLFNFRKHKTIYFSSIRFLKEIKEDKRKRSNLKNLLILLSRIVAIFFLVMAFSKPFIPLNKEHKPTKNIFIYVDNSLSMDIDFGDGNLLNTAKNKAQEIAKGYPKESNIHLLTNDFSPKHNNSYTADDILTQIDAIKASAKIRSIDDIIKKQHTLNNKNSHLYVISDFQRNIIKANEWNRIDSINQVYLIPIKNNNLSNISIDSCFINRPVFIADNEIKLHVIITNTSNTEINDEVIFLNINNKQKSQQYINLLENETQEITFNFSTDQAKIISGELRINDSPIIFDNNLFFTLKRTTKVNVYTINANKENPAFNSLFKNDESLFNYTSINQKNINYKKLSEQDFVVLNELEEMSSGLISSINNFIQTGNSILIVPPSDIADIDNYNTILSAIGVNTLKELRILDNSLKINQFNLEHLIYRNVFKEKLKQVNYPLMHQYFTINNSVLKTQIIGLANKQDFLTVYSKSKGLIYQLTSPLNSVHNTFTKHALFVPTLLNMTTSAIQIDAPYYIIGKDNTFISRYNNKNQDLPHLKNTIIDIIPTTKTINSNQILDMHNQINTNGIYALEYNNKIVDKIAYNYNKNESRTTSFSAKELQNYIIEKKLGKISIITGDKSTLTTTITETQKGKEFWKIALILSLLFFATEILLIKLIKS